MKTYVHPAYKFVNVIEIPKDEISYVDFAACKEPRETLGSFYNRQQKKPDILINGGFFSMANGNPVFNTIDEGIVRSNNTNYRIGIGISYDAINELRFGNLNDGTKWKDFLSAYPVLLNGTGPITKFDYAKEIDYCAVRSCIGYNDTTVFIVHVGKPGLRFAQLSELLDNIGAKFAVNLDGGGSARVLIKGKVFGSPVENRRVDNVVAFYLKNAIADKSNNLAADKSYILYTVKSGDSWWKIAAVNLGDGNRYKELLTFNGMSSTNSKLYPGMQIKIPMNETLYTVVAGDSWWSIAAKTMGSGYRYSELAAYNNKSSTSTLHPGDKLKIPV